MNNQNESYETDITLDENEVSLPSPPAEMKNQISIIDEAYHLAKIRANERITTKIERMTKAETEAIEYKNIINKKYFKNRYYEIERNKKLGIGKLRNLFSGINYKTG